MNDTTDHDDSAMLAVEALAIYRSIMQHAEGAGGNRLTVAILPMRFALNNRLTRLCATFGVKDSQS